MKIIMILYITIFGHLIKQLNMFYPNINSNVQKDYNRMIVRKFITLVYERIRIKIHYKRLDRNIYIFIKILKILL
jgi:hypothetical protein